MKEEFREMIAAQDWVLEGLDLRSEMKSWRIKARSY